MNDKGITVTKTVRHDKETVDMLQELCDELNEDRGWDKVRVSDLIRQGVFIVLAAFGKSPDTEYRWGQRVNRPNSNLVSKLPIVPNWPEIIESHQAAQETAKIPDEQVDQR